MARACIVGVGPGGPAWLTERARSAIEVADAVLGWELNLTPIASLLAGKRLFVQRPRDYLSVAREAVEALRQSGGTLAVVRIGDALVSSGLYGLLALMPDFEIEVIPGISATQLAAALARINLDEAVTVSFHEERRPGEEESFMLEAFRAGRHLVVLTGQRMRPRDTATYLLSQGVTPATEVLVGESLTLPEERITRCSLGDVAGRDFHWLSTLVVRHPTGINPQWPHHPDAGGRQPQC